MAAGQLNMFYIFMFKETITTGLQFDPQEDLLTLSNNYEFSHGLHFLHQQNQELSGWGHRPNLGFVDSHTQQLKTQHKKRFSWTRNSDKRNHKTIVCNTHFPLVKEKLKDQLDIENCQSLRSIASNSQQNDTNDIRKGQASKIDGQKYDFVKGKKINGFTRNINVRKLVHLKSISHSEPKTTIIPEKTINFHPRSEKVKSSNNFTRSLYPLDVSLTNDRKEVENNKIKLNYYLINRLTAKKV